MGMIPVSKFRVEVIPKNPDDIRLIDTINVHVQLDHYRYETLAISLIRNGKMWSVGNSTCFPVSITDAEDVRKAVNMAFKTLKRLEKCIIKGKPFNHE